MGAERARAFQTRANLAVGELRDSLRWIEPEMADRMAREMLAARRIVCAGACREGLMIRAFCMRLMHLGLDAHRAGDMSTPPVGPGDLLIASVGPGRLATLASLLPMGTLFEWLELAFFDLVALDLRERTGQSVEQIRARHTNLE